MKAAENLGIAIRDMVAVVGKLLAGGEARRFADDFIAFYDQTAAIGIDHDPFAAEKPDGAVGFVSNGDEINERVGFIRRQAGPTMVINQFIKVCGQAGKFYGFASQADKPTQFFAGCNFLERPTPKGKHRPK